MPVSVQIHRGNPTGVMLLVGCYRHHPGPVPYIYIDGQRHQMIVDAIIGMAPTFMLHDMICDVDGELIGDDISTVLACLRGEDLLCESRRDTTSGRIAAPLHRAASSGYMRWAIMQARAARIHRLGLSK